MGSVCAWRSRVSSVLAMPPRQTELAEDVLQFSDVHEFGLSFVLSSIKSR